MNFYHSFPRYPKHSDHQYGLNILDSILRIGLLITPELRRVMAYKNLGPVAYLQSRICFTLLEPEKLPEHSKFFGEFALEFHPDTLRELGALPAFYLTGTLENGQLLHHAGENVLRLLVKATELLWMVKELHGSGGPDVKKLIDDRFPPKVNDNDAWLEEVPYALQALLNLYYPTDDHHYEQGKELGYYKQREWKVIPNFAVDGQWAYPSVPDYEKAALLALNREYFSKDLIGKPRIDHCLCFSGIGGKKLLTLVKRLIVPDAVLAEAQQRVSASPHDFPVVPLSQA